MAGTRSSIFLPDSSTPETTDRKVSQRSTIGDSSGLNNAGHSSTYTSLVTASTPIGVTSIRDTARNETYSSSPSRGSYSLSYRKRTSGSINTPHVQRIHPYDVHVATLPIANESCNSHRTCYCDKIVDNVTTYPCAGVCGRSFHFACTVNNCS